MKTIFTSILIFIFYTNLLAQSNILYRVTDPDIPQWEEGDKVGYADANGHMAIPLGKYKYCYTEEFNQIAFIGFANRKGIYAIDRNENILFKVYVTDNKPDQIKENTFRIEHDGKIGFANIYGKTIISPRFDAAWPFQEGFTGVGIKSSTGTIWKFLNKNGIPINNEEYDDLRPFENGLALVMKDGKWGKINQNGMIIIPIKYTFDVVSQ